MIKAGYFRPAQSPESEQILELAIKNQSLLKGIGRILKCWLGKVESLS
jgi:hypothetical protein